MLSIGYIAGLSISLNSFWLSTFSTCIWAKNIIIIKSTTLNENYARYAALVLTVKMRARQKMSHESICQTLESTRTGHKAHEKKILE